MLRSHYGDPLSIYQSIYFPLALLLAGALPRQTGATSFTSPFLVRGYSRGLLAVPCGIIDSMTIRRGAQEHGWNYQNLPLCVNVSFSIKDLSPAMYVSIPPGVNNLSSLLKVFGQNNSFQEYMATLSGWGLQQRLSRYQNIKKRLQLNLELLTTGDLLNPNRVAMDLGSNGIFQAIFAVTPLQGLSLN
jgi:hypothetical protein